VPDPVLKLLITKWIADRQPAFKSQTLADRHWHHWSGCQN